jgi:hypothetical protein
VTTCFGLYHQAIIRSQVNNLRKLDNVIYKTESHRIKMQRDLVVVILYGSIYLFPILIIYDICNFTFLQFYTSYRYYRRTLRCTFPSQCTYVSPVDFKHAIAISLHFGFLGSTHFLCKVRTDPSHDR